jgi:cellulose synthase/poly-beta-1,6-N-acetylglucosamine synthase-like glycosyltransferase
LIFYFFLILSLVYFFLLIAVWIGLNRLKGKATEQTNYSISIIIAARNEEKRISPCLKSLESLDYPEDLYEVILVDDCSEDNTAELIDVYCQRHRNWKCIRLKEKSVRLKGKKNALRKGISEARNELIFTTDADCIVPSGWLKHMGSYFQDDVSMVVGYSPLLPKKKWYFVLLQFDNLFSAIAAAAPLMLGYPFNSVGRNLAYRKSSYNELGGFQALKKYKSGDDIHLTNRFHQHDSRRIDYCADSATFVKTMIPSTDKDIFHQQIRKNSKTFQLSSASITMMIFIFFYHVLLISLPFLSPIYLFSWFILVLVKFILEFIPLYKSTAIFKQPSVAPLIPLMQIIYPLYIILFTLIGSFQQYDWKK